MFVCETEGARELKKKTIILFFAYTLVSTSLGAGQNIVFAQEEGIEEMTYAEEDVIAYFEDLSKEVEGDMEEERVTDKVIDACSTFILFLSDEKEIKGYTWSELSEETKEKIVSIYLDVDSKLVEKYPNYMDKIKVYSKKAKKFVNETYKELKEKVNEKIDEYIKLEKQEEMASKVQEQKQKLEESFSSVKEKVKKWARENQGR